MERLTQKAPDSEMVWFKDKERLFEPCEMSAHQSRLAIAKLAAYEQAEEQGLLIRLPCKEAYSWIGYKIYIIHDGDIEESTHLGLFVFPNGKITIMCDRNKNFKDVEVSEIGKTVFLTRQEAEAKLAEMEGVSDGSME